jgi:SAM-dependent methyltransferase
VTDPSSADLLSSPAAERNRAPILAVLRRILPERGTVLEIASGSGEHAVFFAQALPNLGWQPTDVDPAALRSIAVRVATAGLPNLAPPLVLDAGSKIWPVGQADAIVAINVVHISPWRTSEGLLSGAGRVLEPGGVLYLYGPYKDKGAHTAPSNAAFDVSLKSRNPEWGVRDVGEVVDLARSHGLSLAERVPMPANNLSLVFRRAI